MARWWKWVEAVASTVTRAASTGMACTVTDGAIDQRNFDTYQSLRMAQMPEVETILMASGGFWGGVGEPTIAVAAPAVLNAIAAATGKRYRDVPLKNSDLQFA